jgi:hypothetical protein
MACGAGKGDTRLEDGKVDAEGEGERSVEGVEAEGRGESGGGAKDQT